MRGSVLTRKTLQSKVHGSSQRDLLDEVINAYHQGRMIADWEGSHLLKGKKPHPDDFTFTSNDYLAISNHPHLINCQIKALKNFGNGLLQSSVFQQAEDYQLKLEQRFSQFLGVEDCLLSQSGWNANTGLIQTIANHQTPVYIDIHAHMSLWQGIRLARAKAIPFQHNSPRALIQRLERYGSGIIVVDSIYSTLGSIAPLKEYCRLAKQYNCILIVDESHSLGTHGANGKGLLETLNLVNEVDFITASLAKAFSSRAGIIFSNHKAIECLRYSLYPSIFSSALLPQDLACLEASLDLIEHEQWRRNKLHANHHYLRKKLLELDLYLANSQSQIIPLLCGSETNAKLLRDYLEDKKIFGSVFCWPATSKNGTLIRLSINSNHEIETLDYLASILSTLKQKLKNLNFPLIPSAHIG